VLIEDYDTGKLWAGLYILKMIRSVHNGFGRSQFKKKLAQNRLFKRLQRKNAVVKNEKDGNNGFGEGPGASGGESKSRFNGSTSKNSQTN